MPRLAVPAILLLAGLSAAGTAPAVARSLHWSLMEVTARLDADGRLHVVERQAMVFTGDWNGGMRRFHLELGTRLDLHRVLRVDPATGESRELVEGDLDRVDHFDWVDGETLRWRSRRPTDPFFQGDELVYVLEYTLSGVLRERRGRYLLDHDFAFPDRAGNIERFVLHLELDPAWDPQTPLPEVLERERLPPGTSVPFTAELEYAGAGRPGAVLASAPAALRAAVLAAALAAIVALWVGFRRHETERGRFGPAEAPDRFDRALLEEELFALRPEVVGALWDRRIGPPEVAAVLARLVAEGKLRSSVDEGGGWLSRRRVLSLELLVDRGELRGYERELVDKLFFDGRTETDTDAVRAHYKKRGFDPSAVIRPDLEARLRSMVGGMPGKPGTRLGCWGFAAIPVLLGLEYLTRGGTVQIAVGLLAPTLVLVGPALVLASRYGSWNRRLEPASWGLLGLLLLLTAVCGAALFAGELPGTFPPDFYLGVFAVLAIGLWPVVAAALVCQVARTPDSPAIVARRRRLARVRQHLASELERPEPDLEDAWFPYLLAFGLDGQVDRWFKSFGTSGAGYAMASAAGRASASSGGSQSSSWTGGGGAFGGAGASAGWAAAATGLAAGVAQPSSGGGGGGGSFSGGGGGGGW